MSIKNKLILQWIFALLILALLFWRIDLHRFAEAFQYSEMHLYVPLALAFVTACFLVESQNLMALLNLFGHPVSFKEMRLIRGITYLLMVINYNIGMGGLIWYLKKYKGIPVFRGSSMLFFYYFVDSVGIAFFASLGAILMNNKGDLFYNISIIAGIACFIYIALFLVYRFLPEKGLLGKIKNLELLRVFNEVTVDIFFKIFFLRGCYFAVFIVFFYFDLQTFNIHISIIALISLVPVVFFFANLPVTPFGIGTAQAAMCFLFQDYGTAENILAFSVIYSTTLLVLRAPIGLLYLQKNTFNYKEITQTGS